MFFGDWWDRAKASGEYRVNVRGKEGWLGRVGE